MKIALRRHIAHIAHTVSLIASFATILNAQTAPAKSSPHPIALRFGSLVEGSGRVVRDAVIVVDGDRIVSVGTGDRAVPKGATVHDLRPYTAIPGMVDVHTHMSFWRSRDNPLGTGVTRNKDSVVMLAVENLRKTLETGVTTVRDLGASNYVDIALRDSINKGVMVGPRMYVVGYGLSRATAGRNGGPPARSPTTDASWIRSTLPKRFVRRLPQVLTGSRCTDPPAPTRT